MACWVFKNHFHLPTQGQETTEPNTLKNKFECAVGMPFLSKSVRVSFQNFGCMSTKNRRRLPCFIWERLQCEHRVGSDTFTPCQKRMCIIFSHPRSFFPAGLMPRDAVAVQAAQWQRGEVMPGCGCREEAEKRTQTSLTAGAGPSILAAPTEDLSAASERTSARKMSSAAPTKYCDRVRLCAGTGGE